MKINCLGLQNCANLTKGLNLYSLCSPIEGQSNFCIWKRKFKRNSDKTNELGI